MGVKVYGHKGLRFMAVFSTSNLALRKLSSNLSSKFASLRARPFFPSSFMTSLIASSLASAKAISFSS